METVSGWLSRLRGLSFIEINTAKLSGEPRQEKFFDWNTGIYDSQFGIIFS